MKYLIAFESPADRWFFILDGITELEVKLSELAESVLDSEHLVIYELSDPMVAERRIAVIDCAGRTARQRYIDQSAEEDIRRIWEETPIPDKVMRIGKFLLESFESGRAFTIEGTDMEPMVVTSLNIYRDCGHVEYRYADNRTNDKGSVIDYEDDFSRFFTDLLRWADG